MQQRQQQQRVKKDKLIDYDKIKTQQFFSAIIYDEDEITAAGYIHME